MESCTWEVQKESEKNPFYKNFIKILSLFLENCNVKNIYGGKQVYKPCNVLFLS